MPYMPRQLVKHLYTVRQDVTGGDHHSGVTSDIQPWSPAHELLYAYTVSMHNPRNDNPLFDMTPAIDDAQQNEN